MNRKTKEIVIKKFENDDICPTHSNNVRPRIVQLGMAGVAVVLLTKHHSSAWLLYVAAFKHFYNQLYNNAFLTE